MIIPATNLEIAHCVFEGPGKFPHRTSKDLNRKNMLSVILLQPGGWGTAPGRMEQIYIHDITMSNLDKPLIFILNMGNNGDNIRVEGLLAKGIKMPACSIESWKGGRFGSVLFKDIFIEYVGHGESHLNKLPVGQLHVDAHILPCWRQFARNVDQLSFENIKLKYIGSQVRPAFYFDNIGEVTLNQVTYKDVRQVSGYTIAEKKRE